MLRQITGQTVSQAAQSPTCAQELTTQPDTTIKPESITSTTNEDFIRTTLLSSETKSNEMEDFGPNSSYRYFPLIHSRWSTLVGNRLAELLLGENCYLAIFFISKKCRTFLCWCCQQICIFEFFTLCMYSTEEVNEMDRRTIQGDNLNITEHHDTTEHPVKGGKPFFYWVTLWNSKCMAAVFTQVFEFPQTG